MRLLAGPWSRLTHVLIRGNLDTRKDTRHTHTQGRDQVGTIGRSRRETLGDTVSANTLIVDFQPPGLGGDLLSFELPCLHGDMTARRG